MVDQKGAGGGPSSRGGPSSERHRTKHLFFTNTAGKEKWRLQLLVPVEGELQPNLRLVFRDRILRFVKNGRDCYGGRAGCFTVAKGTVAWGEAGWRLKGFRRYTSVLFFFNNNSGMEGKQLDVFLSSGRFGHLVWAL